MDRCIENLNSILRIYSFTGISLIEKRLVKDCDLIFKPSESDQVSLMEKAMQALLQYKFISGVVCEMLSLNTTLALNIPVESVLNLASNTFSLSCKHLRERKTLDATTILTILPSIQTDCLRIVHNLVNLWVNQLNFLNLSMIDLFQMQRRVDNPFATHKSVDDSSAWINGIPEFIRKCSE